MELKFGDRISITHKYKRKVEYRKNEKNGYEYDWKIWTKEICNEDNCIFLGYRTLSNGIRDYEYDLGYIYNPREYIKSALVCINDKTKPIYVPLDSIVINNEKRLLLTEEEILNYLDSSIECWRKIKENINHIHSDMALYYIDAFQSVRVSLFNKLKE